MAGIADLPAAAGRWLRIEKSCHTVFSIGNRQSATKTDAGRYACAGGDLGVNEQPTRLFPSGS